METGLLLHRNAGTRDETWGRHCEWPPRWMEIPQEVLDFTRQFPNELEEIWQRGFQQKVREALRQLFSLETEDMILEELIFWSRILPFWIADNGTPCFRFFPLWE